MKDKQLSNPFSTGGGGVHFEAHVQASFVTLMLTGGIVPCLPQWPVIGIKLQGRIDGFNTDDLIVIVEEPISKRKAKMLAQIKHKIGITYGDSMLSEVMQAAWNDFNNSNIFSKEKDVIVLITGPLNATDSHNVRWILNQAKHTKDLEEFKRNVTQSNFSPSKSKIKLDILRHHLKLANNNTDISDDDFYSFLNHFYVLAYDLGEEEGIVLSLLHSHIAQFDKQYPHWVWPRIVDIVQTWNQNAGTITFEKLPDDLKELFQLSNVSHIPDKLLIKSENRKADWFNFNEASTLALINLIGMWEENNETDMRILNSLLEKDHPNWLLQAREMLLQNESPLSLSNGVWKTKNRTDLWSILSPRIFDQNLNHLKGLIISVLSEPDPSFELPSEERFAAGVYGKKLTYSSYIRNGLAQSLALLGIRGEDLINCSEGLPETVTIHAIRGIFEGADWKLWGSLNKLLPVLAEAAPEEFLFTVEQALHSEYCPFVELFSQEGSGVTGGNYLTGLLWALESLAWEEQYLVRVCVILGELASLDPGGTWSNRPANSLTTILLPWLPQTVAPIQKRKVAVKTLTKELPKVAWKLLISLLPNQKQTSMGSHKPLWRDSIPEQWREETSQSEYWEQVEFYSDLAISLASKNTILLNQLIDHIDELPRTSFNLLLEILASEKVIEQPEEERFFIWNKLMNLISKHRSFSEAEWALDDELIKLLEKVTTNMIPKNPILLHQRLFGEYDPDLYDDLENWEENSKQLEVKRQQAIIQILELTDIYGVIEFSYKVQSPYYVGISLGAVASENNDEILLSNYLESEEEKHISLMRGYIWSRYASNGWSWVDHLYKANWSVEKINQFLCYLPFSNETWDRAAKWLMENEYEYWTKTDVNPHQKECDLTFAINKLIEYGRPFAAIYCLNVVQHRKNNLNIKQCLLALKAGLSSSEPSYVIKPSMIVGLIKILHQSPEIKFEDLFHIEWGYLPLLNQGGNKVAPTLLEYHISEDPEFFCELIRKIYRSKKSGSLIESNEESQSTASNAWKLLHGWRIPPGSHKNGDFDDGFFLKWLQRVKEICSDSGHLEVALINVGHVLVHSPPDAGGLWINESVATALNDKDADPIRRGFRSGILNSRGAHWVDPTAKPELKLSDEYLRKAEDTENAGFQRFAVTLKDIAEFYAREAKRIIDREKHEDNER